MDDTEIAVARLREENTRLKFEKDCLELTVKQAWQQREDLLQEVGMAQEEARAEINLVRENFWQLEQELKRYKLLMGEATRQLNTQRFTPAGNNITGSLFSEDGQSWKEWITWPAEKAQLLQEIEDLRRDGIDGVRRPDAAAKAYNEADTLRKLQNAEARLKRADAHAAKATVRAEQAREFLVEAHNWFNTFIENGENEDGDVSWSQVIEFEQARAKTDDELQKKLEDFIRRFKDFMPKYLAGIEL